MGLLNYLRLGSFFKNNNNINGLLSCFLYLLFGRWVQNKACFIFFNPLCNFHKSFLFYFYRNFLFLFVLFVNFLFFTNLILFQLLLFNFHLNFNFLLMLLLSLSWLTKLVYLEGLQLTNLWFFIFILTSFITWFLNLSLRLKGI